VIPQLQGLQYVEHAAGGTDLPGNVLQHANQRDGIPAQGRLPTAVCMASALSLWGL
jgi:hypothetical protein